MHYLRKKSIHAFVCVVLLYSCAFLGSQSCASEPRVVNSPACPSPFNLPRYCPTEDRAKIDAALTATCEQLSSAVRFLDVSHYCRGCREENHSIGAKYTKCGQPEMLFENLHFLMESSTRKAITEQLTGIESQGGEVYRGLIKYYESGKNLREIYPEKKDDYIIGIFYFLKAQHASEEEAEEVAKHAGEASEIERQMLVHYLRETGHAKLAFDYALKNLMNGRSSARSGACRTLGKHGRGAELASLIGSMSYTDKNMDVRDSCRDALGKIEVRTKLNSTEGFELPPETPETSETSVVNQTEETPEPSTNTATQETPESP